MILQKIEKNYFRIKLKGHKTYESKFYCIAHHMNNGTKTFTSYSNQLPRSLQQII